MIPVEYDISQTESGRWVASLGDLQSGQCDSEIAARKSLWQVLEMVRLRLNATARLAEKTL